LIEWHIAEKPQRQMQLFRPDPTSEIRRGLFSQCSLHFGDLADDKRIDRDCNERAHVRRFGVFLCDGHRIATVRLNSCERTQLAAIRPREDKQTTEDTEDTEFHAARRWLLGACENLTKEI